MIIRIMPENDFEKQKMQEEEHVGVKEFLIFGNKRDEDGDLVDFHFWTGSYRYLEGSLFHFLTTITEEKKTKSRTQKNQNEIDLKPKAQTKPQFIKRGQVDDQDVKVIDANDLLKSAKKDNDEKEEVKPEIVSESKVIQFPSTKKEDEFVDEHPIDEPAQEENLEAEDKE